MAVQQRIIGGGLLIAGIAVVLILIFLFSDQGISTDEAYQRLLKEIYPEYAKAGEAGEYLAQKRLAEEAKSVEADTAMAALKKKITAEAAAGNRDAQGLQKLLEADAFSKNLEGLYELDGRWYRDTDHDALRRLGQALAEGVPALTDSRRAAKQVSTTLDQLRLGSGLPVEAPAAEAPAHPVAAADAELFRAYGVRPAEVAKALATKGEGAKAKSARLVWNNADGVATRARLASEIEKLPGRAETIGRAAINLSVVAPKVAAANGAQAHVKEMLTRATSHLGAALEPAAREEFQAEATVASLTDQLRQEAKALDAHKTNANALAKALTGGFAE
jgi:hypothetical protein